LARLHGAASGRSANIEAKFRMDAKREQALVGLFVLVAIGLLVATVFLVSGSFGHNDVSYRAYFKNAGGLGPGTSVRYAGGPPVGRVQKVQSDPQDSTRMEIDFSVDPNTPVKTDSTAIITSTSPLGDNYLGIVPGTGAAPRAPSGATLKSEEYVSFSDLASIIAGLGPHANDLVVNLDARAVALKETMDRVNQLLSDQNQKHISGTLADLHGMLDEDRPEIHMAIGNINAMSAKLAPLIDNVKKTSMQADQTLQNVDALVSEDRPDIHASVASLRETLNSTVLLTDQLNQLINTNSEDLDEILDNLRHVTDNLNSFTETIKTRPYTLIRAPGIRPRKPGEAPSK
jgi:phospholipid/cholesterol/gamma-HCH transport system substrate-binding protein